MEKSIWQLYPLPAAEQPLQGTYLAHHLRQNRSASSRAYIYANFVASLDGRIAIRHPARPGLTVPKQTANDRDWRLFQELAAQADVIITTGRYLRDWAEGRAQEILQTDDPRYSDLRQWRQEQGLSPQPDLAIISGGLNFPLPSVLTAGGRRVTFFTTAGADPARVKEVETGVGPVIVAGEASVDGGRLAHHLTELGYRTVYSAAGPQVLHLLLSGGVLDRLYLTTANRLLGGQEVATIVRGPLLAPAVDMTLHTLYYDPHALDGLGQLLAAYNTSA